MTGCVSTGSPPPQAKLGSTGEFQQFKGAERDKVKGKLNELKNACDENPCLEKCLNFDSAIAAKYVFSNAENNFMQMWGAANMLGDAEFSYLIRNVSIDSRKKWYFQFYQILFFNARIFAKDEPVLLRITRKNDGFWDYSAKNEHNSNFNSILKELKKRISN